MDTQADVKGAVASPYANTFFQELSPAWLNYVRAVNGLKTIPLDEPFTYLELGCGFGHSTVVNAAAFPTGMFHGCDVNPNHAAGARAFARALELPNFQFHEAPFQALALGDLPRFDFIVLHGVYSWVGEEARGAIRRIIRQRLSERGLVYLSYNCLPGWSNEVPLRRLMLELAGQERSAPDRARKAVESLAGMRALPFRYFTDNPAAAAAVDAYAKSSGDYLAHEFLAESWEPFSSVEIADEMAGLGLAYLGSATLADNHPALLMDDASAAALAALPSIRQRRLAEDFAVNRRFRRDVFARREAFVGAAYARALDEAVIGVVGSVEDVTAKVSVPRGAISFGEDFVDAVRSILQRGSITVAGAIAALDGQGRDPVEIARNLVFMTAAGALSPFAKAQSLGGRPAARPQPTPMLEKLLAHVMQTQTAYVAPSEILGGGVLIQPTEAAEIYRRSQEAASEDVAEEPTVALRVTRTLLPKLARLGLLN